MHPNPEAHPPLDRIAEVLAERFDLAPSVRYSRPGRFTIWLPTDAQPIGLQRMEVTYDGRPYSTRPLTATFGGVHFWIRTPKRATWSAEHLPPQRNGKAAVEAILPALSRADHDLGGELSRALGRSVYSWDRLLGKRLALARLPLLSEEASHAVG